VEGGGLLARRVVRADGEGLAEGGGITMARGGYFLLSSVLSGWPGLKD